MKKLITFALAIFFSFAAHAQTCGSTKNYTNAADYVTCNSVSSTPPTNIDGTPSTGDALSRYQWNLRALLEGETYASLFADAPRDVKVAVIDEWPGSGGHADLVNNYLTGINLIEGGTNTSGTYNGSGSIVAQLHGQCAAGIIAAEHNSIGTAGVFARAKIIPIRASFPTMAAAINQAVAAGAEVIHVAGFKFTDTDVNGYSLAENYIFADLYSSIQRPALRNVSDRAYIVGNMNDIRAAIEAANEAGVVITNGVANWTGLRTTNFIASRKQVISAGATNAFDEISAFNSMSYSYDIFAPGGDRRNFTFSAVATVIQSDVNSNLDDPLCPAGPTNYSSLTLGSAATPHVAAAAAIVKSYLPTATVEQVRQLLLKSTRPVTPNLNVIQATGGLLSLKKLRTNLP